jgi:hypothetical protein
MSVDRAFVERNRASTDRIRALARLSDAELKRPVGEHWTVAIALVHIAFWDRRILVILDRTEQDGRVIAPPPDTMVNDISLPIWAAVPPREAARLAVETAEALDQRLEALAPDVLEALYASNPRWVERAHHRGEHLDEVEAALKG